MTRVPALRATLAAAGLLLLASTSQQVQAKVPEVRISADSELTFGTFMIFGSGSRTVGTTGTVRDNGVVALEGTRPAPARFTISYDRGNENNHVLDIELELVISAPPLVRQGGVEARLSAYETDLPGALRVDAGRAMRVTMPNCRTRVCTRSFQVGGRLDVTRNFGGAMLVVPILVDVTVISADRQRR